jgi:hypothetical protein
MNTLVREKSQRPEKGVSPLTELLASFADGPKKSAMK